MAVARREGKLGGPARLALRDGLHASFGYQFREVGPKGERLLPRMFHPQQTLEIGILTREFPASSEDPNRGLRVFEPPRAEQRKSNNHR
jgi:hypothetical protein